MKFLVIFLSVLAFQTVNSTFRRIVGGTAVSISSVPYQCALQDKQQFCGGAIISKTAVLTAAHCTEDYKPSDLSIRAGTSRRNSGGVVVPVAKIHDHPNYSSKNTRNDIAVVTLQSSLTISSEIKPIALQPSRQSIAPGTSSFVSGWGDLKENGRPSNSLQGVEIEIVSQAKCKNLYGSGILPGMICAGFLEGKRDSCSGDSGGPLVASDRLVGIVSWGIGCARKKYPGVYAEVAYYRDWIRKVANV